MARIIRRIRAVGLGRGVVLLGLILGGAAAGVAWGWASPLPVQRTFHVTARQYAYEPGVLLANRGDLVRLHVESADVSHGMYIDGYGVSGKAAPGQELDLQFVADKPGRFTLRCSETCGVFHPFMTGELVVEPNLLLPGSIGTAVGAAAAAVLFAGWTARKEETE